jgi:hypothetical protein
MPKSSSAIRVYVRSAQTANALSALGQKVTVRPADPMNLVQVAKVLVGSIASLWPSAGPFRSTPINRHSWCSSASLKRAMNGLMHRGKEGIYSVTSPGARAHSGNPAFRRPSISSFEFEYPPRAMNADIVKVGSVSSTRAAASRASASRPRWAKADARHR